MPYPNTLLTTAEQSGFVHTGRYAEAEALCASFAARWPDAVRCLAFGVSPEGRRLMALVVSRAATPEPAALKAAGVPVLAWQGGIHPGESDGKDAGFMVLRELLEQTGDQDPLRQIAILFVPVLNVDGHERFGRYNRPNQAGPEEMGWRTNAQNLNLNRDYMKADSPEMRAKLRLFVEWDPILFADLHVTNGADFAHDVSVQIEPIHHGAHSLRGRGVQMRDAVIADLAAQGSLPLPFYPNLVEEDDPESGFAESPYHPRFSTGYWALHNRWALLLETHSWKDYATRVRVTCNTLRSLVAHTARDGRAWLQEAAAADAEASAIAGSKVELDYDTSDHTAMIDFKGYTYTRTRSAISGALVTRYQRGVAQNWHVPYRDQIIPTLALTAPRAGYIVPAGYAIDLTERLRAHGIRFVHLPTARPALAVQTFRPTRTDLLPGTFEGRSMRSVAGAWADETVDLPPGAIFVPIAQPRSRLVMALLEPQAPDSFLSWGLFNAAFEQKEYAEPYVAEQMAEALLRNDPTLQQAFDQALAADPVFAANPRARLDWFYRRHSSWDVRYGLVPTYRVDAFDA